MLMQFWGGVIAAYIGIVFTTRALLPELWSPTKVRRYGVIFATLAIAAALSRFVVFAPAPLEIQWTYVDADYPQGTPIAGIPWEPTCSEVQIVITNGTNLEYRDLNAQINSDMVNAAVGQLSTLPGVSFGPYLQSRLVTKMQDKDGNPVAMPIHRIGGIWTVRCERLQAKTSLAVVLAVAKREGDKPKRPPGMGFRTRKLRGALPNSNGRCHDTRKVVTIRRAFRR